MSLLIFIHITYKTPSDEKIKHIIHFPLIENPISLHKSPSNKTLTTYPTFSFFSFTLACICVPKIYTECSTTNQIALNVLHKKKLKEKRQKKTKIFSPSSDPSRNR